MPHCFSRAPFSILIKWQLFHVFLTLGFFNDNHIWFELYSCHFATLYFIKVAFTCTTSTQQMQSMATAIVFPKSCFLQHFSAAQLKWPVYMQLKDIHSVANLQKKLKSEKRENVRQHISMEVDNLFHAPSHQ